MTEHSTSVTAAAPSLLSSTKTGSEFSRAGTIPAEKIRGHIPWLPPANKIPSTALSGSNKNTFATAMSLGRVKSSPVQAPGAFGVHNNIQVAIKYVILIFYIKF